MNRTRFGVILNQICETHDEGYSAEIAKMLMAEGKMRIGDVIKKLVRQDKCKFYLI